MFGHMILTRKKEQTELIIDFMNLNCQDTDKVYFENNQIVSDTDEIC